MGAGGVVRDARVHEEVVQAVCSGIEAMGFEAKGVMESPIRGATSGNKEFVAYFLRQDSAPENDPAG